MADTGIHHIAPTTTSSEFRVAITSELAGGDLVAMTMMLTGTHDGEFDGIPARGEPPRLPLAVFARVEDGRIVEDREFYDTGTMLARLGLGGGREG
jgi:predicted ester cyclase